MSTQSSRRDFDKNKAEGETVENIVNFLAQKCAQQIKSRPDESDDQMNNGQTDCKMDESETNVDGKESNGIIDSVQIMQNNCASNKANNSAIKQTAETTEIEMDDLLGREAKLSSKEIVQTNESESCFKDTKGLEKNNEDKGKSSDDVSDDDFDVLVNRIIDKEVEEDSGSPMSSDQVSLEELIDGIVNKVVHQTKKSNHDTTTDNETDDDESPDNNDNSSDNDEDLNEIEEEDDIAIICYECEFCNKQYFDYGEFEIHLESHKTKHKCTKCKKEYKTEKGLKLHHVKTHKATDLFECALCSKKFEDKKELTIHLRSKHRGSKGKQPYRKSQKPKKKHIKMSRRKTKCDYKCTDCSERFSQPKLLKLHMKKHNNDYRNPKNPQLKCLKCDISVDSVNDLEKHMEIHMKEHHGLIFKCDHCSEIFKNESERDDHLQLIHEKENHKCQYCGVKIKGFENFVSHLRIHTSDFPYYCVACGRRFMSSDYLSAHRETIHADKSSYQCEECDEVLLARAMHSHMREVHPDKPFENFKLNLTSEEDDDPLTKIGLDLAVSLAKEEEEDESEFIGDESEFIGDEETILS